VIMESWLCGTPVIVHELCAVTKGHCMRSEGGLYYKDYESFEEVIQNFSFSKIDRVDMGKKGKQYVEQFYTWENTAERILTFLETKGFKREVLTA
jgi:glycosyltransferase involved in cell wall biosynthesis